MTKFAGGRSRPLIALMLALAGTAVPALAQDASSDARLRRLEAEVRDLRRQAGVDRTVAPQAVPSAPATRVVGTPATTPVADLLSRMDAVESQIARLTAQNEESGNKLRLLEERVAANEARTAPAVPAAAAAPVAAPDALTASSSNLAAMNGTAPPRPVTTPAAGSASATATAASAAATRAAPPRASAASTKPAAPSAQRVAAVRAIVKPQTSDVGEDEYTYGFRLWEAKFYPEAQQQLKLFLDKYPRHSRVSYARNLMGRALLDEDKPREAASWFLQNYQDNKRGDRAPDSLLFLAQSMSQLKDTTRACIALAEFTDTYPQEAAGRLKSQYDATRGSVKCN